MLLLGVVGVVALIWVISSGLGTPAVPTPSSTGNGSTTGANTQPQSQEKIGVGSIAPNFTLPDTNGQTVSLSDFKGKVVLIEFMAPWCPHCQESAPNFNAIQEAYKDQGVQLLAVSATPYGRNYQSGDSSPITMDDMIWFRDTFSVQFPLLFDKDFAQAIAYNVPHFPYVVLVDPNGVVSAIPPNPVTVDSVAPLIEQAKQAAAPAAVAAQGGGTQP